MKYNIEDVEFNVIVERKNNKNTYIRIKENNQVLITTNYFVTKKQIIKLIEQNSNFILKNLKKLQLKEEENKKFMFLGEEYNIIILKNTEVEIINNNIYVSDLKQLNNWLIGEMRILFNERLEYIYNIFEEDIPYPNLKIRKMKTRWGVCNKIKKTVTLNSELIRYDVSKLDYVIIHELCHFIHFDHSAAFWNLVEKYCPIYKKIRKELKD